MIHNDSRVPPACFTGRPLLMRLCACPPCPLSSLSSAVVLADLLSVLGMTFGVVPGESLRFKLLGHASDIATWGSEYARSLAGEIGGEWARRAEERDLGREPPTAEEEAALATAAAAAAAAPAAGAKPSSSPKAPVPGAPLKGAALAKELASTLTLLGPPAGFTALRAMIGEIVPYHMAHNAEVEAVDLLLETESLGMLTAPPGEGGLAVPVDAASYPRVCLYLVKCSDMLQSGAPEEATGCLDVALALYSQHKQVRSLGRLSAGAEAPHRARGRHGAGAAPHRLHPMMSPLCFHLLFLFPALPPAAVPRRPPRGPQAGRPVAGGGAARHLLRCRLG